MKKRLSELRKQLIDTLNEMESLLTSDEIRSIVIVDNEWVESASALIGSFKPRADLFATKVNKIISKIQRKKSVKNTNNTKKPRRKKSI